MANNTLAYGFTGYTGLLSDRITNIGAEAVWTMIADSANEHTRMMNELMADVVSRTTLYSERFHLPGSGTLQPLTPDGDPLPVDDTGNYFDVAYPIDGGGTAFGTDRVTRALMTVEEANRTTLNSLIRDADWTRRHFLASILDNTDRTYTDKQYGSLTVKPLANADVTFHIRGGTTEASNHYLAQSASIDDDNNPFDGVGGVRDQIRKHPSNGNGDIVVFVASNLRDSIEDLTDFTPVTDTDITPGLATDTLRARDLSDIRSFGDEVLGKTNGCWIVEWKALPSDYYIAHSKDAGPFVAMREHNAPELQGFFPEALQGNTNLAKVQMIRLAGFGVRNRVAAVVGQIGNATYQIPSGYSTPLAV